MDTNDLINRFRYHPAITEESKEAHQNLRRLCLELACDFNDVLPEGREKSLAMTHIEEALFWANAAVARNGGPKPADDSGPDPTVVARALPGVLR